MEVTDLSVHWSNLHIYIYLEKSQFNCDEMKLLGTSEPWAI